MPTWSASPTSLCRARCGRGQPNATTGWRCCASHCRHLSASVWNMSLSGSGGVDRRRTLASLLRPKCNHGVLSAVPSP
eukprot:gene16490-biopygen12813